MALQKAWNCLACSRHVRTFGEFKKEIQNTIESLKTGRKPGNTIEILAAALNIGLLGEDLKMTLESWLQLDLWKKVEERGVE